MVLSDEIYSRIYYEEEPGSIASLPGMQEKTIILDGFSKTYAMTGWRLGYGVMPEWLVDAVNKLMVNSNSCTATFTQRAGLAALTGPQDFVTAMMAEFTKRRDAFCAALDTIPGWRCPMPGGAFYAFPNIQGTGEIEGSGGLAAEGGGSRVLEREAFWRDGEGQMRFKYANSQENLMEAVERIWKFLDRAADNADGRRSNSRRTIEPLVPRARPRTRTRCTRRSSVPRTLRYHLPARIERHVFSS